MEKSASQRRLERLCRRHGVPPAIGARLKPLLDRAARSKPEVRRKLLAVVEATLRCDAESIRRRGEPDQRLLVAIAAAFHEW